MNSLKSHIVRAFLMSSEAVIPNTETYSKELYVYRMDDQWLCFNAIVIVYSAITALSYYFPQYITGG